jgi:hypothetical protein
VKSKPVSTLHVATYRHQDGGMPDWKRLGEHVVNRRVELDMPKRDDLATASGISYRILGDIETGRRDNFDRVTLAKLERALQWAPGSAVTIANGGTASPAARVTGQAAITAPTFAATGTLTAGDNLADDPVMRILNSSAPADVKQEIVKQLLAEQRAFAQRRVDELLREALEKQ